MLHIPEISRITCDRFLVFNKAVWLWLFHCVCLEVAAREAGGAAVSYVALSDPPSWLFLEFLQLLKDSQDLVKINSVQTVDVWKDVFYFFNFNSAHMILNECIFFSTVSFTFFPLKRKKNV